MKRMTGILSAGLLLALGTASCTAVEDGSLEAEELGWDGEVLDSEPEPALDADPPSDELEVEADSAEPAGERLEAEPASTCHGPHFVGGGSCFQSIVWLVQANNYCWNNYGIPRTTTYRPLRGSCTGDEYRGAVFFCCR